MRSNRLAPPLLVLTLIGLTGATPPPPEGDRVVAITIDDLPVNERSALWHWRNGFRLVPDGPSPVPPLRNGEGDRG